MIPITDDTAAKLREAAEKATPGPWDHDGPEHSIIVWSSGNDRVCFMTSDGPTKANAAYIALANPQTVLALLDERDSFLASQTRIADLERERDEVRRVSGRHARHLASERTRSTALEAERDAEKARADAAEARVAELEDRLQIGPCGEDNIDQAESAMEHLRHTISTLTAEKDALRQIVHKSASALPNGAYISPDCSIEFMSGLPAEILIVCSDLKRERDEARAALERVCAKAVRLDRHQTGALDDIVPPYIIDEARAVLARTGEPKDE